MGHYRKKPVEIEARQVIDDGPRSNVAYIAAWIESNGGEASSPFTGGLDVHTLEGVMHADHDDWIIRGVKGEFYPCKPDIFEATYDEVSA